jgi:hypothetical protein
VVQFLGPTILGVADPRGEGAAAIHDLTSEDNAAIIAEMPHGGPVDLVRQIEKLRISAAAAVLDTQPDPVVRLRVYRDVLGTGEFASEAARLAQQIDTTQAVRSLAAEQHADGSWGRLHSMDYALRQRYPTTEFAVRRAVSLGLTAEHPLLGRARHHLVSVIRTGVCADPAERNDRWPTGVRLFAASTLSRFDPENSDVVRVRELWSQIASRTFEAGRYDPDREAAAHQELTGASVRQSYLVLHNRYSLELLGSGGNIDREVGHGLADWLVRCPRGIGYLDVPLLNPPFGGTPSHIDRWLTSLDIFLGLRPTMDTLRSLLVDLMASRGDDGLWDFGRRPSRSEVLPLSENWRERRKRKADWSTRVLLILASAEQLAKSL